MTILGDRSARLGNSPARTSTTFIVAKDPGTHFGDTRPAFAKHGAVVIERATYAALSGDRRANDAALWLKPGASAAAGGWPSVVSIGAC